eukprot:TRINITY_DN61779_c0_g1_i1.p1 TRINITY_DN61779_c0_g1~~TRINITY_DN61779_c0_g1_i1.p1  ORF type:complete len:721 (+),score=120.54 TRINITY_DN61779_c0_g1_i1:51-2213(+)
MTPFMRLANVEGLRQSLLGFLFTVEVLVCFTAAQEPPLPSPPTPATSQPRSPSVLPPRPSAPLRGLALGSGNCAEHRLDCGKCWLAGCYYCLLGPEAWSTGDVSANDAAQGDAIDFACLLVSNVEGRAGGVGGCDALLVLRPGTGYVRTVMYDDCDTVGLPTPEPTTTTTNTTTAAAATVEDDGLVECGPVGRCSLVAFIFVLSLASILVATFVTVAVVYRLRQARKKRVQVVPAPPSQAKSMHDHMAAPKVKAAVSSAAAAAANKRLAALTAAAAPGRAAFGEALLWDFSEGGQLQLSDIEAVSTALSSSEATERKAAGGDFSATKPRPRCLAFSASNGLMVEHLKSLMLVLEDHPTASIRLDSDWRNANDATLRALSAILRRRGRCMIRTAKEGVSGPLRLPARASSKGVLSNLAEAVSAGDHGEISTLILEPLEIIAGGASPVTLELSTLRLGTNLAMTNRPVGDLGCALITAFVRPWASRMRVIRMVSCELGNEAAESVAELVAGPAGGTLQELNLSANRIGDRGVKAIAEALADCCELERLILDRNCIGKKGAEALGKHILRSEIRELVLGSHLGGNPCIGELGAIGLADALDDRLSRAAGNRANRLEFLSLEDCAIGDRGAEAIAAKLACSAVTTLSVARCEIRDKTAQMLLEAMPETATALDLAGNLLTNDLGDAVGNVLHKRPKLAVSLAQNLVTPALRQLLQDEHGARLRL